MLGNKLLGLARRKSRVVSLPYDLVKSKVRPVRLQKAKSRITTGGFTVNRCRPVLRHRSGSQLFINNFTSGNRLSLNQVIVISTGVTKYPAFTFLPSTYVYSNKLCVLADERFSMFAILSSDIHGVWAWAQKHRWAAIFIALFTLTATYLRLFRFLSVFLKR